MKSIKIDTDFIKLGQLLKMAGLVDSGAHAKIMIINGDVKLNGNIEMQRGKKVYKGDIVEVEGHSFRIE